MEKINEIKKISSSIKDEIEKKLYCIKSYNFINDEEFKKAFNIEFKVGRNNIDGDSPVMVLLNKKIYNVYKKSRIIDFIIDGKSYKRFIYSCEYLKKVIKALNIQYYSIKDQNLGNSLKSKVVNNDIYDIFSQEKISTIYKIEPNDKKITDLFEKRYTFENNKISDLSLNAKFYYQENSEDKLDLSIFHVNEENFDKLIWNDNVNIIYLFGPKGTSKSIFLMNFSLIHNCNKNPVLYINYKILNNLTLKERKYYFKREMVYLFFDIDRFKDFYKNKYHRIIVNEKNNFICNLKKFIENLINIFENTFDKKITIIIDNFDDNDKNLFSDLEEIITLVNKNPGKLRLITSGHSDFLIKKFVLFLKNKNFSDIIEKQALFIYDLKLKVNDEIKFLAAFNYRKIENDNEFENILLEEEKQYCTKFNLYGLHYSVYNNGKNIGLEQLLKYIYILPCEYLHFLINEDKSVTFNYYNPIFLKAVKNYIKSEIKEKSLQFLLSEDNKDFLINGIYEEKLLSTFISYNKLKLKNMDTPESNLLEVKEIFGFKNKNFVKTDKVIVNGSPIIINQGKFVGESYDLLVLIPKKEKESNIFIYTAYMTQIGTNKNKQQIDKIREDFNEDKNNYLSGIKKFIDNNINIQNIELYMNLVILAKL